MSVAVTAALFDGATVGLRAVDGIITELGPDVVPQPGDDVLDGAHRVLLPGLVNGHTHAAMTLFRGFGGDLPLMEWLERKIWPAESHLTADDVYWGTRLACLEMIRTGTVRFWDMYWQPAAVARAVEDAGIRATVGLPLIDELDGSNAAELRTHALGSLDELGDFGSRISASLAPHGIYTVSEESLDWIAETSSSRGLPVQIHFLEIQDEVVSLHQRTGEQPGAYLERLGLLTPRTVLAHGVWMSEEDLDRVAERGSVLVTNPVSNMKLAVGRVFPYAQARQRGVPVGIGTDGASSNNSLDLLQDVKVLSLLQKYAQDDTTAVPASEAWSIVTGALAPALGGSPKLEVGEPADFLLVRLDAPELGPGHLVDNLVYAAAGAVVDVMVVDGQVLMRDREVPGEQEVRAKARESAERLGVV